MSQPSKIDRIAFWKHTHALRSFKKSNGFLEVLLKENPAVGSPQRGALTIAIVIAYCCPFKQRGPVKLSEDVVPAEYRAVHNEAIDLRDKVLAHRDIDGPDTDWEFINQIRVIVEESEMFIDTSSPDIGNSVAANFLALTNHLVRAMEKETRPFLQNINPRPPKGCYLVSLEDKPTEWLQAVSPDYN